MNDSLPTAYFEALYAADPDPWRFATSDYERAKYQASLDALPCPRFARGFEVGCSIGVLTRQLALRCDRLLAVDVAAAALDRARLACAGLDHVRFENMRVPDAWPDGMFDLIVLSEVLYYLDETDVRRAARATRDSLAPGGVALLVHWTGPTDYPLSADQAVAAFVDEAALTPGEASRAAEYRLDVLRR